MIALLPGEARAHFPRFMDQMLDLRLSVGRSRQGRSSGPVHRLAALDYFDSLDPLYVLALDDNECVAGALRLLPTTGGTMLNDAFAAALPEGQRIESPLIWEASRWTLRDVEDPGGQAPYIDATIGQLGVALNEIAEAAALTHLIAVYDSAVHQLLSLRGCAGEALASLRVDGVEMHAVHYEIGPALDAQFRRLAPDLAFPSVNLADLERRRSSGFRT
jgi:N-acyl-L-homoserine lactone synthetase